MPLPPAPTQTADELHGKNLPKPSLNNRPPQKLPSLVDDYLDTSDDDAEEPPQELTRVAIHLTNQEVLQPKQSVPSKPTRLNNRNKNRLVSSMGEQLGVKTFNVISENKKLLNYLHGLINIASQNPAIFGKSNELSDMPNKEYKKTSNVKYFYRPEKANDATMMPTYLDTLLNQLRVLPQNMSGQYNAMVRTSGVVPNMALPLGLYSLRGGARKSKSRSQHNMIGGGDSFDFMKRLYKGILEDMQRRGKDLVDEDKKHIETAIK
ncbi:MAG: hypothetical protein EBZ95_15190, partial [Chitinophagia bacterium]|nr:hypothetical protein [Chitinophagia bacterium]